MFKILHSSYDNVIKSVNLASVADYSFALAKLTPLIDKLDFQRASLRKSFYNRLENDILNGCVMPFLTIAIKGETAESHVPDEQEILGLLENAFVLDGIQRLNTLKRVSEKIGFNDTYPIYLNILICSSMDRLLYRMVTLNNGQKPMTARHQIEVLASNIFDFENSPLIASTEKQSKLKMKEEGSVITRDTLIKSYISYISDSVNVDNQKIIESKMDELLTDKIMESNITSRETQYYDILNYISNCFNVEALKKWFSVSNNFIGFSSAMATSFAQIMHVSSDDLLEALKLFESVFSAIDVSKIKLGMARRRMVKLFFTNYEKYSTLDDNNLLDKISMEI